MEAQNCIVGLHHCVGHFWGWDHRECFHNAIRVPRLSARLALNPIKMRHTPRTFTRICRLQMRMVLSVRARCSSCSCSCLPEAIVPSLYKTAQSNCCGALLAHLGNEKGAHASPSPAAKGVTQLEALKAIAAFRLIPSRV